MSQIEFRVNDHDSAAFRSSSQQGIVHKEPGFIRSKETATSPGTIIVNYTPINLKFQCQQEKFQQSIDRLVFSSLIVPIDFLRPHEW